MRFQKLRFVIAPVETRCKQIRSGATVVQVWFLVKKLAVTGANFFILIWQLFCQIKKKLVILFTKKGTGRTAGLNYGRPYVSLVQHYLRIKNIANATSRYKTSKKNYSGADRYALDVSTEKKG